MDKLLLSTAYFPPISYFMLIANHRESYIETHENYIKQTYRNRCTIHAAAGALDLSVPVERGSFHKVPIMELAIDYSKEWRRLHLRALEASYNSSAFYEFYIDEIESLLAKKHKLLIDLNNDILSLICNMLGIEPDIKMTGLFIPEWPYSNDMRYNITPKGGEGRLISGERPYFQVFSQENGFIPDLSILDLLFNMGPESYSYLKR